MFFLHVHRPSPFSYQTYVRNIILFHIYNYEYVSFYFHASGKYAVMRSYSIHRHTDTWMGRMKNKPSPSAK